MALTEAEFSDEGPHQESKQREEQKEQEEKPVPEGLANTQSPESEAFKLLSRAVVVMNGTKGIGRGSRELSIAITEAETALLWLEQDIKLKAVVRAVGGGQEH